MTKAKAGLHVIIIKTIAAELRQKLPHLRIEGHPTPSPRLVVRNRKTENGVNVAIDLFKPSSRDKASGNPVIFFASLYKTKTKVSWPNDLNASTRLVIDLDDTESFNKFDTWIMEIIEKHVLPEPPPQPPQEPVEVVTASKTELWGTPVRTVEDQNTSVSSPLL